MDVLDHILEEHEKFREMASAVESSEGKDKKSCSDSSMQR